MKHPPGNKRHTGTTQPTDSSFALLLMRDSSHSMSRSISPHYFPSAVLIIFQLRLVLDRLANVGAMVWIGLNHLKDGRGWQWADGAPLSLVNFTTGTDY